MPTANAILYGDVPCQTVVPGLRAEDTRRAIGGLIRFLRCVPEERQRPWTLDLPRDPEYLEPDDGIIRKNGADKKIYLHFRPDMRQRLTEQGLALTNKETEWLYACGRVWEACARAVDKIARRMDEEMPGHLFAERVDAYRSQHCLRVLAYRPCAGSLAHPHYDRSATTFQLAQFPDGFYTLDGGNYRLHGSCTPPETLVFTGQQLERVTKGAIPSTLHGAMDQTSGTMPRYAVVFFGKMYPFDA
jgi:hypothetical protein